MGWLDFFRSKNETKEEAKNITLSGAEILLEQELDKEEDMVGKIKKRINKKISEFVSNLNDKIRVLNSIDLKERKEHEKIKLITLKNLEGYINQLNLLISNLEKIDKEIKIYSYFTEINLSIDIFIKSSRKRLQKATILIGKELAQTEEIVKGFYKEINRIARENTSTTSKIKNIEKLQSLKESILRIKETQNRINNIISILKKEKKEVVNEKTEKEKELRLFKESREFKEWIEKKERIKNEIEKLNKDVTRIKEKIDLKSLLKQFHGVEEKWRLIKKYRNNFLNTLKEDEELEIIQMIEDNQKESIGGEVKRIREKSLHLKKENESCSTNKKIDTFSTVLRKKDYEIAEIAGKIEEENKRLRRFNKRENALQEEIIKTIENILEGVEIVAPKIKNLNTHMY